MEYDAFVVVSLSSLALLTRRLKMSLLRVVFDIRSSNPKGGRSYPGEPVQHHRQHQKRDPLPFLAPHRPHEDAHRRPPQNPPWLSLPLLLKPRRRE